MNDIFGYCGWTPFGMSGHSEVSLAGGMMLTCYRLSVASGTPKTK